MNFIELKAQNGYTVLINLANVTRITQDSNGMATVCFDGDEHINLNERFDDLASTIETMQRRMGG